MRSVALDLAAKKISFCEVSDGNVVGRTTVRAVGGLEDRLGPGQPRARVAIEACREAWVVHDMLSAWGHEVLLVDTTRVKQLGIGHHGRKTDRIDAEVLARAVESGRVPLAHVLSPARRVLRHELAVRRALVEARAQLVTTVRGLLRAHGSKVASCAPEAFVAHVRAMTLPDDLRALLDPLVGTIDRLELELAQVELRQQRVCLQEPIIGLLMSAPGVGATVAAAFVSVIDDASRFQNAHQVESYLGLVPSEDSSGTHRRIGAISRRGNPYLRSLLVQAAWCVLRLKEDHPLKVWGLAVAQRRSKAIAAIAVARRLAGVLWAMWRDGTFYDPTPLARATAAGYRRQARGVEGQAETMDRVARKTKVAARWAKRKLEARM
jgi:transposase